MATTQQENSGQSFLALIPEDHFPVGNVTLLISSQRQLACRIDGCRVTSW